MYASVVAPHASPVIVASGLAVLSALRYDAACDPKSTCLLWRRCSPTCACTFLINPSTCTRFVVHNLRDLLGYGRALILKRV
jgi:hypothetical protein